VFSSDFIAAISLLAFLSLEAKAYDMDLYKLIRAGNVVEVNKLLSKGIKVNQQDYKGMTPLMRAASIGHTQIAKLLVEKND